MSNIAIIENTDYPEDLCCPISHDLMINPVLISDGHTYEKNNIIRWLKTNNKSPLTNEIVKFNYYEQDKFIKKMMCHHLIKEHNLSKKEANIIISNDCDNVGTIRDIVCPPN